MIITDRKALLEHYHRLTADDLILGRILLRPSEENILVDLVSRGVRIFPSALSQIISRSKTLQAKLFENYLPPHTKAIHDRHDLIRAIPSYSRGSVTKVVTKSDRDNGGRGVHLWSSIEDVFSHAAHGMISYPFVLQPYFIRIEKDIRIIVLGDYKESYCRHNPSNFRNNLYFGGKSTPYDLTPEQWSLCETVMERGGFPNAHIDLVVTDAGKTYFSEINLYGGIKGAQIKKSQYQERISAIYNEHISEIYGQQAGDNKQ
jgi:glutathione synthase/RimK-type ligase-like ATP-grasp enzyme